MGSREARVNSRFRIAHLALLAQGLVTGGALGLTNVVSGTVR